ncbi:MAG: class I SAM-dependent methyltransferase [Candidatus Hodarchaeales archaeon]
MKGEFSIELKKVLTGVIFHNLRILHAVTPEDTYIDNYKWHWDKWGDEFFDLYHLCFWYGLNYHPKRIIEIGARTGLSLAQLLSAYLDFDGMRVVIFDRFDDGLSSPELVKKHLNHLGIPTNFLEFHVGDSNVTVPEFKESNKDKFDWILVDGSHQEPYVSNDLENVKDLVVEGGLIVVDDINSRPEDKIQVKEAWKKFKKKYKEYFEFHEELHGKGVGWAIKNGKPFKTLKVQEQHQPQQHLISSFFHFYK